MDNQSSTTSTSTNDRKNYKMSSPKAKAGGEGNNKDHPKYKAVPTVWEHSCPVKHEAVYFESLPSYHEFFIDIFLKNQLCMLGPDCTDSWASKRFWVTERGTPAFEYLRQHFGPALAPVTYCNATDCNSSNTKIGMTVSDFIAYWKEYRASGHPSFGKCLYLKDWHFSRDFPFYRAYSPPSLLCSDWLNEFWDVRRDGGAENADDYRFVYMGPKNTWTPFHSDVLRSYSWSANICGRKKWIFFPPGEENKLRDEFGQLVDDLMDPALKDRGKYPQAEGVLEDKSIVVIQNPGEVVFVPSGWHHQVFNLEDTISINHNWMNGCSIHLTWTFLKSQLAKVKEEIADCVGMEGFDMQCQRILKADSGMDYIEFYNLLATIARHRIRALNAFYQHVTTTRVEGDPVLSSSEDATYVPSTHHKSRRNLSNIRLCLWNAARCSSSSKSTCSKSAFDIIKEEDILIIPRGHERLSCPNLESAALSTSESLSVKHKPKDSGFSDFKSDLVSNSQFSKSEIDCVSECVVLEGCDNSDGESLNNCDVNPEFITLKSDFTQGLKSDGQDSEFSDNMMKTEPKKMKNKPEESRVDCLDLDLDSESYGAGTRRHDNCPHWSHCDCRLAVFDLQRVLVILKDVTRQAGWEDILEEAKLETPVNTDAGCVLFEDYAALASAIKDCLSKIRESQGLN